MKKISDILNIGMEWLTDITIPRSNIIYKQEGNGTNFQNTGDVNYTITHPVEQVKEAYTNKITLLEKNFQSSLDDKNRTINHLETKNKELMDKLIQVTASVKK